MPLSKARNRQRMRLNRLHKAISTPQASKAVQPELYSSWRDAHPELDNYGHPRDIDADGNVIPDYE